MSASPPPRSGAGSTATGAEVTVEGVVATVEGAQAVVIRDGRVLLQLRPWPPGWELPGGRLGPDESVLDCAVREVAEETGLEVAARGLAGVYRWVGLRHGGDAVVWAEVVGGAPHRSVEQVRLRWFAPDRLPRATFPWVPLRVADAVAAAGGAQPRLRTQHVGLAQVLFFGSAWLAHVVDVVRARRRPRPHRRGGGPG